MNRRSSYLFAWGIAFTFLGILVLERGGRGFIELHFGIAGALAILGAVTKNPWFDRIGFIAISASSAAQAAWHIWQLFDTQVISNAYAVILWVAVASAQTIVAGWPEPNVEVIVEERK